LRFSINFALHSSHRPDILVISKPLWKWCQCDRPIKQLYVRSICNMYNSI